MTRSVNAAPSAREREQLGSAAYAPHREVGVQGAAVDVGPCCGMDDDFCPVADQPVLDPFRRVEI